MKILAIESSCDESALSIVELSKDDEVIVVAETISSQIALHILYGGVVPELASREHLRNLPVLYQQIDGRHDLRTIDGIAVTSGPGLQGCLLMGISFAQGLAKGLSKPLYGINHIEGHLYAPFIDSPDISFPFLALIVSGGHTEIIYVTKPGHYEVLARSKDDAAGEAFDKSAFLLGYEYPGGVHLANQADTVNESRFALPRLKDDPHSFSFSGLKTAIRMLIQKQPTDDAQIKAELCYAVQAAIIHELLLKVRYHVAQKNCSRLLVTGGVAANKKLRSEIAATVDAQTYFARPVHCTDNAAMIGTAALIRHKFGVLQNSNLSVRPGWRIEVD